MQIAIDFERLRVLRTQMEGAPQLVREELTRAVTEADLLIAREVAEAAPSGAGGAAGLKGSITHVERVVGLGVEGFVFSPLNYARPVELGTRPHFPPVDALIDWVKVKFGVDGVQARGIAFAVARKISVRGTKGAFMFRDTFRRLEPQVRAIFERAQQRILQRLGGEA